MSLHLTPTPAQPIKLPPLGERLPIAMIQHGKELYDYDIDDMCHAILAQVFNPGEQRVRCDTVELPLSVAFAIVDKARSVLGIEDTSQARAYDAMLAAERERRASSAGPNVVPFHPKAGVVSIPFQGTAS